MSQVKKDAVREFLGWGLAKERPLVLAQQNRGILGVVPSQKIDPLIDACFDKEPAKPKEPKPPKKTKKQKPEAKAETAPKAEEAPVAPPSPLAYGKGEAPDEIPNPAAGAPVPPKGA